MKNDCKHDWYRSHPGFMQCTKCQKSAPIIHMKNISHEEFKKQYPQFTLECGPIIINELK